MLAFEKPDFNQFADNIGSILYVGVFSGGVGYTFQLIGQRYAAPAIASLLMCLESVFALLGGWIIGGEVLMIWEYFGCALLLRGCVIAQLPDKQISA
jgi:drug/metabolite transporter (DMT)-like permease